MDRQASLSWQGTGFTDTGLARQTNQDAFLIDNDLGLWIVADGMGGHAGGSTASQLAVKAINDNIESAAISFPDFRNRIDQVEERLRSAVAAADSLIRATADTTPDLRGMGTTIVVGLFCPGPEPSIALAHIGDDWRVLQAFNPVRGLYYVLSHGFDGLVVMGLVFLAVTGAEARC